MSAFLASIMFALAVLLAGSALITLALLPQQMEIQRLEFRSALIAIHQTATAQTVATPTPR